MKPPTSVIISAPSILSSAVSSPVMVNPVRSSSWPGAVQLHISPSSVHSMMKPELRPDRSVRNPAILPASALRPVSFLRGITAELSFIFFDSVIKSAIVISPLIR